MKHRNDSGGYTLQTIIVSSILLVVATIASVALYRAITTSADVRSIADLRVEGDERAPTEPHNFSFSYSDGTTTINWSPPVYTGTIQLEASVSDLHYLVSDCQDDEHEAPATITTTPVTSLPHELIGVPLNEKCILYVRAYSCPSPTQTTSTSTPTTSTSTPTTSTSTPPSTAAPDPKCEGRRGNQRIIGPIVTYEFTPTETASAPRNLSIRAIETQWLVSWDTPERIGIGEEEGRLYYKIEGYNVAEVDGTPTATLITALFPKCTFGNFLLTGKNEGDNSFNRISVSSYVFTSGTIPPEIENNDCPSNEGKTAADSIATANPEHTSLPSPPTGLTISPATEDDINIGETGEDDIRAATILVKRGILADIVLAKLTWEIDESADSYLLQWAKADGSEMARLLEIDDTSEVANGTFLWLENGVGYNFSLWARNSIGESTPYRDCVAVGSHSPPSGARPLKPKIDVQYIENNSNLLVRIATPDYADSCEPEKYCSMEQEKRCRPSGPSNYQLRITETCSTNDATSAFPSKRCANDDDYCIPVSESISEVILPLPSDFKQAIEAIAILDPCGEEAGGGAGDQDSIESVIRFVGPISLPAYTTIPTIPSE